MKKILCLLLAIMLVVSVSIPAVANEPVLPSTQNTIPDGYVLYDRETSYVDDGSGNLVEVTTEEYRRPSNGLIAPLADVGEERIYTFQISNTALGVTSLVTGAPIPKAAKDALAKIVAKKLGEKIGAALIPGLNLASFFIAAFATINDLVGNEGFEVTVYVEYTEYFEHKEGIYTHGWDITDWDFGTY